MHPQMSLFTTQEVNGDHRIFFINSYSAIARKVICGVSIVIKLCSLWGISRGYILALSITHLYHVVISLDK